MKIESSRNVWFVSFHFIFFYFSSFQGGKRANKESEEMFHVC